MDNMKRVAVIGAGGWGTALSRLVSNQGVDVMLWSYEEDVTGEINSHHENRTYLPGVALPRGLRATPSLEEALEGADGVIMAVPSRFTRRTAEQWASLYVPNTFVLNASKGLDPSTHSTMSKAILEAIPSLDPESMAVLSGPNHAEEVGRDVPSATVVASRSLSTASVWQNLLSSDSFRVYINPDVLGVELGGALKNVVALAGGMCDGLGFGDNTKAALLTRGLAEMARLGSVLGASPLTFAGLSGLGDLMATAGSRHSRNRWAGEEIGRGRPVEEVLSGTRMVVEGVYTTGSAVVLGRKSGVHVPLAEKILEILEGRCAPGEAVSQLMGRNPAQELEDWWTTHVHVAFD